MSAVDNALAIRNLVLAIDEDGALAAEFVDHKAVVNDFLPNINGRTERFEGDADNIDGTDHSGAEPSRL